MGYFLSKNKRVLKKATKRPAKAKLCQNEKTSKAYSSSVQVLLLLAKLVSLTILVCRLVKRVSDSESQTEDAIQRIASAVDATDVALTRRITVRVR